MAKKLKNFSDEEKIELLSEPEIKCLGCGHISPTNFEITFWGKILNMGVNESRIEVIDGVKTIKGICHQCLFEKIKRQSIRCCLCGRAIIPGDSVAVYDYNCNEKLIHKDIATFVGDETNPTALGCLFRDCADGAFYGGTWTTDGFVSAFGEGACIAQVALAKPGEFISAENL